MTSKKYCASLTGNPFLFFETRVTAKLLLGGIVKKEILADIIQSNLFQYKNTKSIPKRFNAIYKRISALDSSLLETLADGSLEEAKIINLLAVARSDRLFREFIAETINDPLNRYKKNLTRLDFERFFKFKRETIPEVQKWSDQTIQRLIQVYIQMLVQSGFLDNRKNKTIQRFLTSHEFKEILERSFHPELVRIITV
ncbi:MAG: DUF1819 family protein [Candidatus Omnitrophica bacterium]|nr:DUF1819 family protein [Candidatus Omnitrophota bacterium]